MALAIMYCNTSLQVLHNVIVSTMIVLMIVFVASYLPYADSRQYQHSGTCTRHADTHNARQTRTTRGRLHNAREIARHTSTCNKAKESLHTC